MAHRSEIDTQEQTVGTVPDTAALHEVVRLVGAILDVPVVVVMLLDPMTGELVTRARVAPTPDAPSTVPGSRVAPDDIAADVAAHLTPVFLSGTDPRLRAYLPDAGPSATLVCAPLMGAGSLLGTLLVASPDGGAGEAASEASFQSLCDLVAAAVGALMREEAAHASARMTARLLSVARSLNSSLDPTHTRAAAVTGIRRLVPCEQVALLLREPSDDGRMSGPSTSSHGATPLTRRDVRIATLWHAGTTSTEGSTRARSIGAGERSNGLDERQWLLVEWVFAQRRPRALAPGEVVEAAHAHDASPPAPATKSPASEADVPALYCVPLERDTAERAEPLGVMLVGRARPFQPAEIRLLAHLAYIVAAAIEHSQAHQIARIQHERLAAILASASDALAIVDGTLGLIEVNPAFTRLLGRSPSEVRGVRICEALHGHPESGCLLCKRTCLARQVLESGEALAHVDCELEGEASHAEARLESYRTLQLERRAIDFSLTPVAGPDGQGVLLIGRDTTAARETERMRASFLSVLSHELRQPLQAITGWIGIALEPPNTPVDPQQRTFLRRAFIASEHMSALVDDLLLLSNRDAGTFSLQPKRQPLGPLLQQAIEEMEIRATQEEVRLELDTPDDLPEVSVDGLRLSQVLRNLLANAIKFTPKGGRVIVSADTQPGEVLIRVRDTGIGIPPEHQERIFERYYQVHDSGYESERYRGHGLGLAIVRIIAEGHGGSTTLESAPGQGSTFSVHLPR